MVKRIRKESACKSKGRKDWLREPEDQEWSGENHHERIDMVEDAARPSLAERGKE